MTKETHPLKNHEKMKLSIFQIKLLKFKYLPVEQQSVELEEIEEVVIMIPSNNGSKDILKGKEGNQSHVKIERFHSVQQNFLKRLQSA